jgi:hypothetical protein
MFGDKKLQKTCCELPQAHVGKDSPRTPMEPTTETLRVENCAGVRCRVSGKPAGCVSTTTFSPRALLNRNKPGVVRRAIRAFRCRNFHARKRYRAAPPRGPRNPGIRVAISLPPDRLVPSSSSFVPHGGRPPRSPPHAPHHWHILGAAWHRISLVPNGRHEPLDAVADIGALMGSHRRWLGASRRLASYHSQRAAAPPIGRGRRSRLILHPGPRRLP